MADGANAAPAASSRRLLNATAIMASGTLISRLLGFVKATLLVIVIGATTPQADAYALATLVPNTLYMIFAGGALNTVLVPQIVRHIKSDDDAGEAFVNRIMTAFLVLLAAVTVLATVLAPQVMSLWTAAEWREPAMEGHWRQLVLLAFLTMPQLFFFGAFFLIGQVLNARDRFGPMMWAPILNNVVGIAVLGLYVLVWGTNVSQDVPFSDQQVLLLGLGSTLGILVQTLALLPPMRAIGFSYRPRWDLKGQGLGETFHLAKWMLGYVLLTSVVQVVVMQLASGATVAVQDEPGAGVMAYQTAYLVWILPHSLLTVSLATAMLPSASRLAAAGDLPGVAAETTRTLRLATTFLVPAAFGFLALGLPFSRLAFGHGASGEEGWVFIGYTLMAFALGLIPFTIQYLYLRAYYALEDTRTPFLLQLGIAAANVAAAYLLMAVSDDPYTVAPRLAMAYGLSYLVGAVITHLTLRRRLQALAGAGLVRHLTQLALAALPGAGIAALLGWWALRSGSGWLVVAGFLGAVAVALVGFFFVAKRLGVAETGQLLAVLRRRGAASADDGEVPAGVTPSSGTAPAGSEAGDAAGEVASGDQPLLAYPDPTRAADAPSLGPDGSELVGHVSRGQVLNGRYRLDEPLARRGRTLTWLGFDLTLARPVLIHVMQPDEPRALEILDQARQSAPAVDSRFLRVWDAVLVEDQPHGSYIVCEYAPGQSLELALRQGAFSEVEAAWTVLQVAEGLINMHAQGLYHRQLSPDTVVVTASGNVKIVGFLVENALHPAPDASDDGEAADVLALGRLLYAALLARWPGTAAYGLPAAPRDASGRPLLPRQVSARVSEELSGIVDRIISRTPRGGASRLTTAAEVARALSIVLRGQDASRSLDRRLSFPVAPVRITQPRVDVALPGAGMTGAVGVTGALGAAVGSAVSPSLRGNPDARPALPQSRASASEADDEDVDTQTFGLSELIDAEDGTDRFTPIPPPAGRTPAERKPAAPGAPGVPSRRWQGYLVGLFLLALATGLVMVFLDAFERRTATVEPGAAHPVAAARDFDPSGDGGDDTENPDLAALVIDGDPQTAWTTERYGRSADFNGRKPGAGVLLDLGEPRDVRWATVVLGDGVTTGELRVPRDPTATTPPLTAADDWRTVAGLGPATGEVELRLDDVERTRFVLVYLTTLPKVGANHVGSIHEVTVGP